MKMQCRRNLNNLCRYFTLKKMKHNSLPIYVCSVHNRFFLKSTVTGKIVTLLCRNLIPPYPGD